MKPLVDIGPNGERSIPIAAIERWLERRGWSWLMLERGEIPHPATGLPVTTDDIQFSLCQEDPVLFAEMMLTETPENGGGPWRPWAFQRASLRYRGDKVHEDGAEVGKTREIVVECLWADSMHVGGGLTAGAEDGNLDEIWDSIQFQVANSPFLRAMLDAKASKVKPYRKLVWRNGNVRRFRPAGHDGRAFRSIHVGGYANHFDEAAVPDDQVVFSEFFRALLPTGEAHLYSVPNGRRSSPYYQLCERALPFTSLPPQHRRGLPRDGARRFVKFQWPQTIKPEPWWGPVREAQAIERYGGRDTPGYVRNVLGMWGDPSDTVFPWRVFSPCVTFVDAYVVAKIQFDGNTKTYYVEAHQLNKGYQVRQGSDAFGEGDEDEDRTELGPLVRIYRQDFTKGNLDLTNLLRRLFSEAAGKLGPHRVAGADIGQSNDPTEIGVSELIGEQSRWSLRLQLKGLGYGEQAEVFHAMDEIVAPDFGWGLDATGVGRAVEHHILDRPGGHNFQDRLTGYVFNSKTEVTDPSTDEPLIDLATGRPGKISLKELATQTLEAALQAGRIVVPWDPDYLRDFPSHTATQLRNGERTFSGKNDHVIDEKRVEALRVLEVDGGVSAPILCHVPANAGRDQTLMRDY